MPSEKMTRFFYHFEKKFNSKEEQKSKLYFNSKKVKIRVIKVELKFSLFYILTRSELKYVTKWS